VPTVNLTDRWLKSGACKATGEGRQTDYFDEALPGFMVRVSPVTGRKSFAYRYRINGKRRCLKLGTYPATKLGEARDRAKDAQRDVDKGVDPAQAKREARAKQPPMTVAEFLDEYLERHSKPRKRSWKADQLRVKRIKAKLGKMPLTDLTTPDVARLHSQIGRKGQVEANRVIQLLTAALNMAREWGHLDEGAPNVAARVKRFTESSRNRFLTRDEIPRVVEAIGKESNPFVRAALLTILLCGLRRGEALALRWADVDAAHRLLRIPKTKTDRQRVVPLPSAALRIIEALPRVHGNSHVFAGQGAGYVSVSTIVRAWRSIREAAGVEDVTIHDLRRTTGSHMAMAGEGLPIVGAILGHDSRTATAIYARLQPDSGRAALDRYGDMLTELAGGDEALGLADQKQTKARR
jgi:integrase